MSKKAPLSLEGNLERIAGKLLGNTRMIPARLREKVKLLGDVYGRAAVQEDFEKWCRDGVGTAGQYPIIDYIREIDSRLGSTPKQERVDTRDPRVEEISAFVYEKIGTLPPKKPIATLLLDYTPEEITGAFNEYVEKLSQDEFELGVRKFFTEGGAVTIIFVRRKRVNDQSRKNQ